MDYPKSVPNVGLVNGKFIDENPSTGQVGSLIPSAWGNAVTQELLSVITAAGLTPDENQVNQLLKAIQTFASADMKKTVKVATTGAIALSGLQSIDGVALVAGDRVLVKNQTAASQNGIYSVQAGVWLRAQDADENIEISPGMMVPVQAGTVNYGSIWQLSNVAPPTVGSTALTFEQIVGNTGIAAGTYKSLTVDRRGRAVAGTNPTTLAGFGITDAYTAANMNDLLNLKAPLASPNFTGAPTTTTPAINSNNQQVANTAFVHAAVSAIIAGAPGALDTLKELADALGGDPNFANTIVKSLALKANKADVLPLAGGEMTGNITMLNGRSVLLMAQDTPSWASGLLCRGTLGNEALGGLGIWGNREVINCAYLGLGNTPWITGNGVRVTANGVDVTGPLSGNGSGLTNLKWSALESTPTDLGAYGVTFASQNEAEAGKEPGKPMSPLRVFQAITAKVIQATENIVGIARIASQVLVNLGEDDASIVTPKKLRFGLSYLVDVNGYFVFPTWMGGLIIQWGLASAVGKAGTTGMGPYRDITLPIAFPVACLGVQATMNFSTMTSSAAGAPGATVVSNSVIRLQNNYSSSAGDIKYFAIGF